MAMKRRKLGNPLALAVLVTLWEKPMHPYEIAQTLRRRGKDTSTKINYGSLYTVVQSLEKHGFVEVTDVERQGNRPERTVYGLTGAGREEMTEWLSDLVAVPAKEYPIFETALSLVGALPPDEVVRLLEERLNSLEVQAASGRGALEKLCETLPRLFLIETEYQLHMIEAQAEWVRGLLEEIRKGSLPGVEGWRRFHETGELPPEFR
ncbi:PadR family transcriptional regulator [Streptomyces sp. NBC_00847]|uniref:PadR family transcriptional regulator n=1 Tax=unclassified Streptomyces TaxID=2593676 RepID=UPI002258D676|nr:PadR family transcriptional regulator [Streptomyces sp. NBC_00847]MCX4879621.1 PadR family transcriptional regulator [Streptomyces sp. NBC_00847]